MTKDVCVWCWTPVKVENTKKNHVCCMQCMTIEYLFQKWQGKDLVEQERRNAKGKDK